MGVSDEPIKLSSTSKGVTVQSVSNALKLLECLAERRQMTLSNIAAITGFSLNQTFRLLATLEAAGYVLRARDKRYQLGPKLHVLGQQVSPTNTLVKIAASELDALAEASGETVLLSVRVGFERMIIDSRPSRHSLRVSYPLGSKIPLYVGGMGVAMLAFVEDDVCKQIMQQQPRQMFTEHTLGDVLALQAELDRVRERGVRVSRDDYAIGEFSVAAAIVDGSSQLRGALAIAGFTARLNIATQSNYSELVKSAALRIGEGLERA